MTAIQRFGSALNLNVHFHTLAVQGVFVDDGCGGLRFVPNPEPSEGEVEALLLATARRITRLVKRRGIDLERPQAEEPVDRLASESPLLAGISGASVFGRVATGGRAGEVVLRVGRKSDGRCAPRSPSGRLTSEASTSTPQSPCRPATVIGSSTSADTCCVRRSRKTPSSSRRTGRFSSGSAGPGTTAHARSSSSRTN